MHFHHHTTAYVLDYDVADAEPVPVPYGVTRCSPYHARVTVAEVEDRPGEFVATCLELNGYQTRKDGTPSPMVLSSATYRLGSAHSETPPPPSIMPVVFDAIARVEAWHA